MSYSLKIDYHRICPGDHETLMCNTNHTFLEWSVSIISQPSFHETRSISYLDQNPTISPIMINSVNFTLSRDSSPRALPLVSTMTIKNVTNALEGTVVSCTGINSSSASSVVLLKTIHVFDVCRGRSTRFCSDYNFF